MTETQRIRAGRSAAAPRGARVTSLDGLRGLAALVVVIHHALLTWQVLANQYLVANPTSGSWWLTFTPLHVFWAGTEAVMVFFVLSGFVLVLPFLDRRPGAAGWRRYYGRRLIRLYVPVAASLALAALLVMLLPRVPGPTTSWWFDAHAVPVDLATLGQDALLVRPASWIHPSLWSLQHEVAFSVLLPVYVVVARRLRHHVLLPALGLLFLVGLGTYVGSASLSWLPVFGIGTCLAVSRARLDVLGARIEAVRRPSLVWAGLGTATVVMLLAEWWARALFPLSAPLLAVARPVAVAGAALVCILVMVCPAARGLCSWGPVRWLGLVSFSLYLVHEPIVVSVSSLVGGSLRGVAVTVTVGTVLSLAAAALFHRLVEAPSQRLAVAVGDVLGGRRTDLRPPVHVPAPRPAAPGRVAAAARPSVEDTVVLPVATCDETLAFERPPLVTGGR